MFIFDVASDSPNHGFSAFNYSFSSSSFSSSWSSSCISSELVHLPYPPVALISVLALSSPFSPAAASCGGKHPNHSLTVTSSSSGKFSHAVELRMLCESRVSTTTFTSIATSPSSLAGQLDSFFQDLVTELGR